MTLRRDTLPLEICMREDGHVDDVALSAVADGQDSILPPEPLAHLATCDSCTRRLGDAAMLSSEVGFAMAALAASPSSAPATVRFPVPVRMILGAMALAFMGLVPGLTSLPARVGELMSWLTHSMPLFLRTFAQLFRGAEGGLGALGVALSASAAFVLVSLGLAVARAMPRPSLAEGATS
jgi:hypothetical protein